MTRECERCGTETERPFELFERDVCDGCVDAFDAWFAPWWSAGAKASLTEGRKL